MGIFGIPLVMRLLPFRDPVPIRLGLRAENDDDGVAIDTTPGEDSREDDVCDLTNEAVDASRSFEGTFDCDCELLGAKYCACKRVIETVVESKVE